MNVFDAIYGTSALEGINVGDLLGKIETYLEEGPMFFPEDMVTDHPERFIVSEIIREKVLNYFAFENDKRAFLDLFSKKSIKRLCFCANF